MQQAKTARAKGIKDAIRSLPRELFIEMKDPNRVLGRSIPPTQAVVDILGHANIEPHHSVLQVGTGAGYLSALASRLAARVVTMEINPAIARWAQS
nr:protein-L-isoaspartate(D-aspartate) O-methyltransferase [Halioglobus sp.]